MQKESPNQLILQKIEALQSALFFPETPDGLLPISILKQVTTDDQENILFSIPWSNYAADLIGTSFPCNMDFFKKGANYHLKISGIASLTEDLSAVQKRQLLVKVKIQQVLSFDIRDEVAKSGAKKNLASTVGNALNKLSLQAFNKALHSLLKTGYN